jgi:UDP-glucuronate 4-epimerase
MGSFRPSLARFIILGIPMSDTVLLTGAAGFIGSHVAERLLATGATVVGVDNFDPFYDPAEKRANIEAALKHPAYRLVEADCADPAALDVALDALPGDADFDVVVHLAAKAGVRPSIEDPDAYVRANLVATQAMLGLAHRRGIRRFVFGSSSSVYGNNRKVPFTELDPVGEPISPYAATKRGGELLCHTHHHLYGTPIHCLRFFTVYGPRQRPDLAIRKFGTLMLRGREIPMFGDGSTERDYTWIGDIVDGVEASIRRTATKPEEFQIINLGGNRTTSLARLIELIGDAVGVEPRVRRLPEQPGDVQRTYADVARARELLGYQPVMPIERGIPAFVAWLKARESSTTLTT